MRKKKRKVWGKPGDVNGLMCSQNSKLVIFEERRPRVQTDLKENHDTLPFLAPKAEFGDQWAAMDWSY